MNSKSSVTDWLRALEKGDDDAARRLWERYSGQMHDVARRRMRRLTRKDIVEEEDMVVSAFASLCLAARKGQLTGVKDRNELWGLIIVATLRKVGQRSEYTQAAKRGAGLLIDQGQRCAELGSGMQRVACDSPSPVSAALQAERVEELLSKLNDDDLRAVALLQLAGKPVGVSLPHPGDEWGIFSAHFSPDGQRLLTTNKDGFARLWDWRTGSLTCPPLEHADELFDAAFLGDGRFCVTSERGDRIHLWDLTSGKRMSKPIQLRSHKFGAGQESVGPICVVGNRVFASDESPMIDASRFLIEPKESTQSLLLLAELATGQRLQQGTMRSLTPQEWTQTWGLYSRRLIPSSTFK